MPTQQQLLSELADAADLVRTLQDHLAEAQGWNLLRADEWLAKADSLTLSL